MKELIEDIIYFFENNKNINYEILAKHIKSVSKINKDPELIISLLEEEALIYEINGIYRLVPKKYKKFTLKTSLKGNLYVTLEDGKKIIIPKENLNGALANDEILYEIDGKVIKILKRNSSPVLCQIKEKNGIKRLEPHNIKGIMNLKLNEKALAKLMDGDYIFVKPDKDKVNNAFACQQIGERIILTDTNVDPRLQLIALEHEGYLDYPKEVYDELESVPESVSEKEANTRKNYDFRDEKIFTIDGITTKDIDDAVGLIGKNVVVSIAEPNYYAKKGSALQQEACKRKFTMYLLNIAYHMFPTKLANGICSLNEGEDRLTKSVIMEIDENGIIKSSKICKSIINSKKKMNYDDVNSIIENDVTPEGYEPFVKNLKELETITDRIDRQKESEGLIKLETTKTEIKIDENNNPTFMQENRGRSERMIETLMILANSEVATLLFNSSLPSIYRTHGEPNKIILNEVCSILSNMGYEINKKELEKNPRYIAQILNEIKKINDQDLTIACNMLLSSFKRAKYETIPSMHWALFLMLYTHFTSPIRRYVDYQIHELLDMLFELEQTDELIIRENYNPLKHNINIDKKLFKELKAELTLDAEDATRKEKIFDQAEYQANNLIILDAMKKEIGKTTKAVIQMIEPEYIKIMTSDGIEGIVYYEDILNDRYYYNDYKKYAIGKNNQIKLKIGNEVIVTIKAIDDYKEQVLFTLNSKISKNNNPKKLIKK